MRLTQYTDFSLRVLIYLALAGDTLVTIREIAERYDISKNHLMKVVYALASNGFVETVRGKNGGLCLARAPENIGIGEVVRAMEPDFALVECFRPGNQCVITPACRLKSILGQAAEAFNGLLDRYTLADMLEGERMELASLLGMPPVADDEGRSTSSEAPGQHLSAGRARHDS